MILRAGAIGDTLMVTPLVRALRRTFPHAYLIFLCSRTAQDILCHNPHLDRVIALAYRHLPIWLSPEKLRILRYLRHLKLDGVLALESRPRLLDVVCRAGAARVVGYGYLPDGKGFERVRFDPRRHCIENHLRAAEGLGLQAAGPEMELFYPSEWDEALRKRLARAGIQEEDCLLGIHPGWGGRKYPLHQTRLRSWPAHNFAHVIQGVVKTMGARVVLTGSAADRSLAEYIARLAAVPSLNLAGELTVLELAALIRRLHLYLTVDSGPAHMAAALGTPLITLWGPGVLEQTAPLAGRGPVRILYHRVQCAPCYGTLRMKICQDNICMKQIEAAEVLEAVGQAWRSWGRQNPETIRPRCELRPRA